MGLKRLFGYPDGFDLRMVYIHEANVTARVFAVCFTVMVVFAVAAWGFVRVYADQTLVESIAEILAPGGVASILLWRKLSRIRREESPIVARPMSIIATYRLPWRGGPGKGANP